MKSNIIVVNVLSEECYKDAHIKGSINVCVFDEKGTFDAFLKQVDKNNTYVFYCAVPSCHASHDAVMKAVEAGFKNVYEYKGGIAEWYQKSLIDDRYKCEGPCLQEWLKNSLDQYVHEDCGDYKIITAEDLLKML
jgi:rhodanese-related sulfurtransferase